MSDANTVSREMGVERSALPRPTTTRPARWARLPVVFLGLLFTLMQTSVAFGQSAGLTATVVNSTQINLSWTSVPAGGNVYLRRCEGAGCDVGSAPIIASNLANPGSYLDNTVTLAPGVTVRYIVVGSNGFYIADVAIPAEVPGSGDGNTGGGLGNSGDTPELGSLALFGSGATGLAGYAWTRVRGLRRKKVDA